MYLFISTSCSKCALLPFIMAHQLQITQSTLLNVPCYKLAGQDRYLAIDSFLHVLGRQRNGRFALPGPLPVSLDNRALGTLCQGDYYVCEKNDGERLCILFTQLWGIRICIGFSRNGDAFLINIKQADQSLHQGTILDCEIARDKAGNVQLIIFDCLCLEGTDLQQRSFSERLDAATVAVGRVLYSPSDTARMSVKPAYKFSEFDKFVAYYHDALDHQHMDGFIFIPNAMPVVYGRHATMYKWKSPDDHTIDFELGYGNNLLIFDRAIRKSVPVGKLLPGPASQGIPFAGSIVECKLVSGNQWQLVRVRADKNKGNDMITYRSTLDTIAEHITQRRIFDEFTKCKKTMTAVNSTNTKQNVTINKTASKANKQNDRQNNKQTNEQINKQNDRQNNKKNDKQINKQNDKQTNDHAAKCQAYKTIKSCNDAPERCAWVPRKKCLPLSQDGKPIMGDSPVKVNSQETKLETKKPQKPKKPSTKVEDHSNNAQNHTTKCKRHKTIKECNESKDDCHWVPRLKCLAGKAAK